MKKRIRNIAVLGALLIGASGWIPAQTTGGETPPDRAVVPLSNPSQPAKIEISVMRGSVTVRAVEGREIVVESRPREKALSEIYSGQRYAVSVPHPPAPPAPPSPFEEKSAKAKSLAEQEALAKVIIKEKEIKEVQVKFDEESRKTAEARRAAREKKAEGMKTDQGEIYTDFDMVMTQSPARHERSDRGESERFRITFDRSVVGAINGGGSEISLTTFTGNIYIRKGK